MVRYNSACFVPLSWFWLLATLRVTEMHNVQSSVALLISVDSCLQLLSWSQSISRGFTPFPDVFYFSQHSCLFQRTWPSHDVPEIGQLQFCLFCLQQCFRPFWRSRVFIEFSSNIIWINVFLSAFFSVQLLHSCIVIIGLWECGWS